MKIKFCRFLWEDCPPARWKIVLGWTGSPTPECVYVYVNMYMIMM